MKESSKLGHIINYIVDGGMWRRMSSKRLNKGLVTGSID